jgi:rhamnosyltransferase
MNPPPKEDNVKNTSVCVLLATFNGISYISTQIKSILDQKNCTVSILIFDDSSTDGTLSFLQYLDETHENVKLLPQVKAFGCAAMSFFYLIENAEVLKYDYFAFCDQDDIWHADKLTRHIAISKASKAEAVSSNVTAFWPNGKQKLIEKSQPQKKYDYLFESAGPGCTFLMSSWLIGQLKILLLDNDNAANKVALHDWLVYAVCRANNKTWIIDSAPSLLYRQHANNILGANKGLKAFKSRIIKLKSGWYRNEVIKIATICNLIQPSSETSKFIASLQNKRLSSSFFLITRCWNFRRKFSDRLFLMTCILIGIF